MLYAKYSKLSAFSAARARVQTNLLLAYLGGGKSNTAVREAATVTREKEERLEAEERRRRLREEGGALSISRTGEAGRMNGQTL